MKLRTPLSILQLHTDNLSEAKSPADMLNANLAIQKSTKRLSHLVFQLMEIQKLEHLDQLRFLPTVLLNVLSDAMAQIESKYLDNVSWDIQVDSATQTYSLKLHYFNVYYGIFWITQPTCARKRLCGQSEC